MLFQHKLVSKEYKFEGLNGTFFLREHPNILICQLHMSPNITLEVVTLSKKTYDHKELSTIIRY